MPASAGWHSTALFLACGWRLVETLLEKEREGKLADDIFVEIFGRISQPDGRTTGGWRSPITSMQNRNNYHSIRLPFGA